MNFQRAVYLEELNKNPVFSLFVVVLGTALTVYLSFRFASISYVNDQIKSTKEEISTQNNHFKEIIKEKVQRDLGEIKQSIKEMEKNILEIYKEVKYQEGKNAKKYN